MRVCLFTDTLGDVNGVSRFIQNTARQANESGRDLTVLTSTRFPVPDWPNVRNFEPRIAGKMPRYENLELVLPPVVKMMREVERLQPDVVHISTPGPVGTVGLIASRLLGCPRLGVYHTDFPAYIDHLFDDAAFTWATRMGMKGFYRSFSRIFARSEDYRESLVALGIPRQRLLALQPGIDIDAFHVRHRDERVWERLVPDLPAGTVKVLSVGRVSVEKNLPLLTTAWKRVDDECRARGLRAHLVVVGDGPYRAQMERELGGRNATFLGFRHGAELSAIYASGDLFVFPSTTDTLGQVVMEAQSSGMPVIVSDQGGPKEVVDCGSNGRPGTGRVLPGADPARWAETMIGLIMNAALRRAMGAAAHAAMQRMSFRASFEHFWAEHERAWREGSGRVA